MMIKVYFAVLAVMLASVFVSCKKDGFTVAAMITNRKSGEDTDMDADGLDKTDSRGLSAQPPSQRIINIAHSATYVPYDFLNDSGESDGFEVSVMRAIDDMLPQYTFRFHAVSTDELLIGVESGKYQAGIKGVWVTEERRKKYLFPAEPLAVSVIGIAYRSSDNAVIHDIDSFAQYSGKLVPISPMSAQYAIVTDYNKTHNEHPITLVPSDVFDIADAYTWVLEGRYDAYFDLAVLYQHNVMDANGAYHDYANKLSYAPYKGIPTWPLFNRQEKELADDYDAAIKAIESDGTFSTLSKQYFGEDLLPYMAERSD